MNSTTLSVCMIVKNEEQYLDACLSSLGNHVDEIIVVDTGSTDRTIEIAQKFNTDIFQIEWKNDFSYARNFSLSKATMDWILVLDADEVVSEDELIKIKRIIQNTGAHAYQLVIRNMLPPGEIVSYREQPAIRLFKNHSGIEYRGMIHESVQAFLIESNLSTYKSMIYINHYGYAQVVAQGNESRGERNLSLLLESLKTNKFDAYIHYQLGITYKHQNQFDLATDHLKSALSHNKKELSSDIVSEIFLKLAQISSLEGNAKRTIKYAKNSLEQNPNNLIAQYLLSIQLVENKLFKEAIPHLQSLLHSELIPPEEKEDIKVLLHFSLSQK
jgi:glycosyltransferase involved in cell wall biosynthesis